MSHSRSTAARPSAWCGRATVVRPGRSQPASGTSSKPDDRHVLGHAQAGLGQRLVGAHGQVVVEADQRRGGGPAQQPPGRGQPLGRAATRRSRTAGPQALPGGGERLGDAPQPLDPGQRPGRHLVGRRSPDADQADAVAVAGVQQQPRGGPPGARPRPAARSASARPPGVTALSRTAGTWRSPVGSSRSRVYMLASTSPSTCRSPIEPSRRRSSSTSPPDSPMRSMSSRSRARSRAPLIMLPASCEVATVSETKPSVPVRPGAQPDGHRVAAVARSRPPPAARAPRRRAEMRSSRARPDSTSEAAVEETPAARATSASVARATAATPTSVRCRAPGSG